MPKYKVKLCRICVKNWTKKGCKLIERYEKISIQNPLPSHIPMVFESGKRLKERLKSDEMPQNKICKIVSKLCQKFEKKND